MKTAIKHKSDEFLVISLQHVSGLHALKIRLKPKNYGKQLMKTAIKHENDEFWVLTLKYLRSLEISLEPQNCGK